MTAPPPNWKTTEVRKCPACGESFWPRNSEAYCKWVERKTCNLTCLAALKSIRSRKGGRL